MTEQPLADLVDLESFLTGDEASILEQVSAAIRSFCGWHIAPSRSEDLTVDGKGSRLLWLPTMYLTGVSNVTSDGDVVDPDRYDWSATGYVELRHGWWSCRPRGVVASVTHGYAEIPAEVVEVIVSVAARAVASPSGFTREQVGQVAFSHALSGEGVSGGVSLLGHERGILSRYTLPPRP